MRKKAVAPNDQAPATKADIKLLKTELKTGIIDEVGQMLSEVMTVIAENQRVLLEDIQALKADVAILKADVAEMKVDIAELKAGFKDLKRETNELRRRDMYIESRLDPTIEQIKEVRKVLHLPPQTIGV